MWRKYLIIFCLFVRAALIPHEVKGYQIDSLIRNLATLEEDTNKVNLYLDIAFKMTFSDAKKSIYYADSALRLATKIDFFKGIYTAQNRLGLAYLYQENFSKALEFSLRALDNHERINDPTGVARDLNLIGMIYSNQEKLSESIAIYNQLLATLPKGKLPIAWASAYSNLGMAQFDLGQLDSAFLNYEKSLEVLVASGDLDRTAFVLDNMANVLIEKGKFDEAINLLNQSILLNEKEENKDGVGENYLKLARIYLLSKKYDQSINYLNKTLAISERYNLIEEKKLAITYFKRIYFEIGDYERAFEYSEIERILSDSLLLVEQKEQIETIKSEAEFNRIRRDLDQSTDEVKSQKTLIYVFIIFAFFLLGFIYLLLKFFRNKVHSNAVLSQLNNEMSVQSIELKQASDQIHTMNKGLEKLVQERTQALQIQNKKLLEYAHFNAHEIRGPMARLTGLLNLCKKYPDEIENEEFINRVFIAISELSGKVEEISNIFKEDDSMNDSENNEPTI